MPLRVDVIESLDQLVPLRDVYHDLLTESLSGRAFFYRIDQLRALASVHAGARRSLFMLLAWRGDALAGALPLVREKKSLSRAGVRRLILWGGDGTVMNIDGDIPLRGTDAECSETVHAFRDALAGPLANRYDEIEFGYLRGDARALPLLERAFHDGTWSTEPLQRYCVDLTCGAAAWRESRSRERMRNIGRLRRRLEELGAVAIEECVSLTDNDVLGISELHRHRQRSLASHGKTRELPFDDPDRASGITALLGAASASGHSRHQLLFVGDTLVAFLLTFVEDTTMFAWLTAMHDDYAAYSPGAILSSGRRLSASSRAASWITLSWEWVTPFSRRPWPTTSRTRVACSGNLPDSRCRECVLRSGER